MNLLSASTFRPLKSVSALLLAASIAACSASDAGGDPSSTNEENGAENAGGHGSSTATTAGAQLPSDHGSAPASPDAPGVDPTPPTTPRNPTMPTTPAPTPIAMPFRGVNLAGGEFGNALPGTENIDYRWPTNAEVDYYVSKGMNTFRVGFKWERLQSAAYQSFQTAYAAKLDALVSYATATGAKVILNPHNFARYYGSTIGSSQVPNAVFSDFWSKLSAKYASNPRVMFNLVNEPNTMPTEQWVSAANAAIAAIRKTGAQNIIIVPGNAWTGAHSWTSNSYGTPNSVAMLDIVDPIDKSIFEVHQYLDGDSSGSAYDCVSTTIGTQRMKPFIDWLRANNKKGFVGEFAGGRNATCNAAVNDMLTTLHASSDVLVGWLWWAAGPGWGTYPFSLEPTPSGQDQPQMSLLLPRLAGLPLAAPAAL